MERLDHYRQKLKELKVCVVIPTYNNAQTLAQVISGVSVFTDNIIIINDGSTDNTDGVLRQFSQFHCRSYSPNVGKGWALRQSFDWAINAGYDYAITIDSDGQHFPADIPAFIDKLEFQRSSIILGARNMKQEGIPGKSSFGHKFSNFWFWFETGVKALDTQTGYRLYPLQFMEGMKFYTKKYEFEIEVLVRASWKGIGIESVPVNVFYSQRKHGFHISGHSKISRESQY